ncbi:conserved protein of unknown function [Pararobbsia alpina]|uniref:hypothetical protein n=1 Tax=Pararobbsia alpina TaxID=621374 RepID=UPI0039A68B15
MRKTQILKISGKNAGRDKGKAFLITELSAEDAENWGARALFVMMNSGVEIPDELLESGLSGIAALGIKSLTKVPYDAAKPLLDEMMRCIQFAPDGNREIARDLVADDIEEVATRLQLRKAVLDLHFSFFTDAAPSSSGSEAAKSAAG